MATPSPRQPGLEDIYCLSGARQAFANRVSRCFNSLCDTFEDDHATALFLQRFRTATVMWNTAKAAIEAEYPRDP